MDSVDNDGDGLVDLDDLDCFRCAPFDVGIENTPEEIGVGQALTLTARYTPTAEIGPVEYVWSTGALTSAAGNTAVYRWTTPGTYTVTVQVSSICRNNTASVEIRVMGEASVQQIYLPIVVR